MPVKLAPNVYWVGAIDWDLRSCGSYNTPYGTTYNSYLIIGEKIALIDTVKDAFAQEMLSRIKEIVDPEKIDFLICQHAEKDHSGAIEEVLSCLKNAKVFTSEAGKKTLKAHFAKDFNAEIVRTSDSLSLGNKNLKFIEAKMMHWPDNMFSFLEEDKILFSNDAFGQHIASSERFEDEIDSPNVFQEAAKYYAVIVSVYASLVQKKLKEVSDLKLDVNMIAPAHGLIWRDPLKIIKGYDDWSSGRASKKVTIVFDTMWGSTEKMAHSIAKGIIESGFEAAVFNLRTSDWSEVVKDIIASRFVAVGSPTLNMGMYPTVGGFLTFLKGIRPTNKKAVAFGSYGWGKGAAKAINEELDKCGFQKLEAIEVEYIPKQEDLMACERLGKSIVASVTD